MFKNVFEAPLSIRIFFMASILMVAALLTSTILFKKSTKPICSYKPVATSNQAIQEELNKACGTPVKLNTFQDIPFVFLFSALIIGALIWFSLIFLLLKYRVWDCALRGDCDGIDDYYVIFAIGFGFLLIFLLCTFVGIAKANDRICSNATSSNCKAQSINTSYFALLIFSAVCASILFVGQLIYLLFIRDVISS